MNRNVTVVAAAVVIGLSLVGFLRGTSPADYDLEAPYRPWMHAEGEADPHRALSYTGMRERNDATGEDVAKGCEDCHEGRVDPAPKGKRVMHPVGIQVPRATDLLALFTAGGRVDIDADTGERRIECRTCHRPHDATNDSRLIVTNDEGALCLSCHKDHSPARSHHPLNVKLTPNVQARIVGLDGPDNNILSCLSCHDPHEATAGKLMRTSGGETACTFCHDGEAKALGHGHGGQSCEDCHGMHTPPAWTGHGGAAGEAQDQPCVSCHDDEIDTRAGHPIWLAGDDEGELVGCSDCHVPHASGPGLPAKGNVAATCTSCHEEMKAVVGGPHDAAVKAVGGHSLTCASCHDVHGLGEVPKAPKGVNPASGACLSCHADGGAAPSPGPGTHPTGLLLTSTGLPFKPVGEPPYFNAKGQRTTGRGEIECQTCHEPHGDGKDFLREPAELKPYCAVCHGDETTQRFEKYHDAAFREQIKPAEP